MSGFVETLLARFDKELSEHAHAALATPQNRDDFEYGRVSGVYLGLHRARAILKEVIEDADETDRNL